MPKYIFFTVLFLLLQLTKVAAQSGSYATELIPKPLQSYANAVIRNQESSVEVKALDLVIYKHRQAITILNGNGFEYAPVNIFYDKSNPVKNLKAAIYDNNGQLLKRIAEKDFQDVSAINDFSMFEDTRVKHFEPQISNYPFTIEYEYEQRTKHTFHFPTWVPQISGDVAVQKSVYRFLAKADYKIRIKESNIPGPPKQTTVGDLIQTEWIAEDIAALKAEPYSPPAIQYLTKVEIAPVTFTYEGIPGQINNWQEYGKWSYDNLQKGRDVLPEATIAQAKGLIKPTDTPEEKVRKIYEFAQKKNRYISVQIGIGGLQPMKAEEVDRLGYGDCKALTNYTKALLKAINIPAIYTELMAGDRKVSYLPDFASASQGNHVILCVPMAKDTLWLECTSREAPMGYLGSFTDDRLALLCTENGGIITRTKCYKPEQNKQLRTALFTLDENGVLEGTIETRFEGTQYDNRDAVIAKTAKERENMVARIYPVNNMEFKKYDITQQKTLMPATIEKMEVRAANFGTLDNAMLVVPVNHFNRSISAPKEIRNRKTKVAINRGFYDEDILRYKLPTGFKTEYMPQPISIQNEFGSFSAIATIEKDQVIYTRKFTLKQGEFAPETYDKFVSFLKKIAEADRENMILVRK